jgi:hypothetical protein
MLDAPGPSAATAGYAPAGDRPLGGYAALMGAFGVLFGGSLAAAATRRELPDRIDAHDVVLVGLATHKLTRLIAKDKVTSPFRAPFTEFQEESGHGEVAEKARGRGLRRAVGELVVCPYCLGQWVAGAFAVGLVAAPRPTRLLAGMWTAQAIADAAQLAYVAAEGR